MLLLGLLKANFRKSLTPVKIIVTIGIDWILVLTGIWLWHGALPPDLDGFIDHGRNEVLKFFLSIFAIFKHGRTNLLFLRLFIFVNPVALEKLSFDCFWLFSDGWVLNGFGFVGQFDTVLIRVKILSGWFSFELKTVFDDQNTVLLDNFYILIFSFVVFLDIISLNSQVIFNCWIFCFGSSEIKLRELSPLFWELI